MFEVLQSNTELYHLISVAFSYASSMVLSCLPHSVTVACRPWICLDHAL